MRAKRTVMRQTVLAAIAACCFAFYAHAQQAGDFNAAYGYSSTSQARTAAVTPDSTAGTASFGVFLTPSWLLAVSTQTFTSSHVPGASRTWGYGVTKLEGNHDWLLSRAEKSPHPLHLEADYTLTLPTDGTEPPGVEHYTHQLLGMLDYDRSAQNYFELDVGDYLGARPSAPGYKQTALLSLVAQHNLRADGRSRTTFDFEVDASPSSEDAPASAVLTVGAEHSFRPKARNASSGITLTALALAGLTANDPAVGFVVRIKFTGNLARKPLEAHNALSFSKLQRLENSRFGRLGRF